MIKFKYLRSIVALSVLCAATPALASDFSGMAWIFLAILAIVAIFAILIVFSIRQVAGRGGPVVDAISAVLLAACFAPATVGQVDGETFFTLFPAWMIVAFDGDWRALFPGPAFSFAVTAGLLFLLFKTHRERRTAKKADEAE